MASLPHPFALVADQSNRLSKEYYDCLREIIRELTELLDDDDPAATDSPWITPEEFGAVGDAATDDTAAFAALAAHINSEGGGVHVYFSPGAIYKIWPNGTAASTLCTISGAKSVTLHGNGAKLFTDASAADLGVNLQVFRVLDTIGFQVSDLTYEQSYTTLDGTNGATFVYLQGATEGARVINCRQNGGIAFVSCNRITPTSAGQARVRDVELSGYIENVYYGVICAASGDQVTGRLKTVNSGRSAILYNVHQVELWIESTHGGPFDDVEIVAYGIDGLTFLENTVSDISIHYLTHGRVVGTVGSGSICRLAFAQLGAVHAAAYMRNIKLDFNVARGGADATATLLNFTKSDLSGPDTTARGHRLHNLEIGGYITGQSVNNIMQLFTTTGDMGGEEVHNVIVRDFTADGCSTDININADGFTSLILENISASGCDINVTNDGVGVLKTVGFGLSDNLSW